MGCSGSKLDDLQAVALCRDRSEHIAEAIRHRYALADAHLAYLVSLRDVGLYFKDFFDSRALPLPPSPVLPLPPHRKGDPVTPLSPVVAAATAPAISSSAAAAAAPRHSHSDSGSHLHFHDSDDDLSDDDDGTLHSGHSSPLHHHLTPPNEDFFTGGYTAYMNYAQKGPPAPSVSYEQRAVSPQAVQVGESQFYGYPYPSQNPNYYGDPYPYPYPAAYSGYGGMGGFFGGDPSPPPVSAPPPPTEPRPPPPPPSPPKASTWDFLNPFESYESYFPSFTPSRSSNELREEEGIPDLEEDENEVVKEAYDDQKSAAASSSAANGDVHVSSKAAVSTMEEDARKSMGEEPYYQVRSSGAGEGGSGSSNPVHDVHLVDKNVVANNVQPRSVEEGFRPESRGVSDVAKEIMDQFDKASASCAEVSKMLEVGKHPYQRKKYEVVSAKMMSAIVPPVSINSAQTSTSKSGEPSSSGGQEGSICLEFDEEKAMMSGNLSSTLQKLYIWEKKLYEEVRAEEKMRLLHDRKCKRLKHLDERGAESHKVDSTQALVKKLSTKIRIAIQVVDCISNKISKLRDEELWPQLNELIQGLVRMWKFMTECHRTQYQAIMESKNLDAITISGKLSDVHMETTTQLELKLLNWLDTFFTWFNAQKSFVKALNGWLFGCLLYEPEETSDGIAPFSPGRLGAPPVFVICHQWSQDMDKISEKEEREVIEAMQAFATSVLQLWEQHRLEDRQRMMANRDMDRRLKTQEREEQTIRKAVDALNKKLALVSAQNHLPICGPIVYQSHLSEVSIHSGLKQLFEAMERFTDNSMKMYENLRIRSEEERVARENAKVS